MALSFSGFDIKANVKMISLDSHGQLPVLQVEHISSEVAVKLLDLEFTTEEISTKAAEDMTRSLKNTFDQRFFSQMTVEREKVQDMILYILRVCVRAVLTRENTPFVVLDAPISGTINSSLQDWMPPLSSVKAVLSMDFEVLNEEEEDDVIRFFLTNRKRS